MELVSSYPTPGNWNDADCQLKRYPICHIPPDPVVYPKSLLEEAKETLNYYNSDKEGQQVLVYMFGKYARDGMIELGGVDNFATALAGA